MATERGGRARAPIRGQSDNDTEVDELPEDLDDGDGAVVVDLDALPKDEERKGKKGGEEREGEELGNLDAVVEDSDKTLQQRRREERAARKTARQQRERELEARVESSERELAQIKQERESAKLEGARNRVGELEEAMRTAQRQYNEAKAAKEAAFKDRDNADSASIITRADEIMAAASRSYEESGYQRQELINRVEEERRTPKVSQALKTHAAAFMKDLWEGYDPKGGDRDSAAVAAIDRKLAADGWDPNVAGYWEELRERVRDALPHRFDDVARDRQQDRQEERQEDRPARRRGPPSGGSDRDLGDRNSGGRNTFTLSSARVKALKEAGMWDDPKQRAKMIRTYQQRDEQERQRRERQGGY